MQFLQQVAESNLDLKSLNCYVMLHTILKILPPTLTKTFELFSQLYYSYMQSSVNIHYYILTMLVATFAQLQSPRYMQFPHQSQLYTTPTVGRNYQLKNRKNPTKKMVFFKPSSCTFLLLAISFSGFLLCDAKKQFESRKVQENENPYVFSDEDFTTMFKTQEGEVKVLKKFTESSELFRGIENIRMLVFEANPYTFVIPSHWDSDILFFVGQGRGTITLVFEDRIESFNIEKGHLMTVPAGITFYMISSDDHEKLILYGFIKPVANVGHFSPFFGVGGLNPESFYHAFSTEVFETAFNTSSDQSQNVFSQQRNGVIIRASKDQIKALTVKEDTDLPHGSSYCLNEFGPCQILDNDKGSMEFGAGFMVLPTDYVKLQDLDMYISFIVTSQGCMNIPFHSTRATKVTMVVSGRGRFEIAAPYHEEGSTRIRYKKISAEVKPGMVFVVPPGYPLVLMASQDEILETVNFEAKGNEKVSLGGRKNIMKNFQKEAKELAFAMSAEEVDDVLNRQQLDFLMRGPIKLQGRNTAAF